MGGRAGQRFSGPRSRNHGNSSDGHSTPTSNHTLKRHQQRRACHTLGWPFREGNLIFTRYHWGNINSFFHINLANPNLQSKDKCPAAQPGRGLVCLWYQKPVACLSFAFYLFFLLVRNSAAQDFQQEKPGGG